eukprot:COSAG03_NODE_662_length_6392_cov_2.901001_1_plen_79_part_00
MREQSERDTAVLREELEQVRRQDTEMRLELTSSKAALAQAHAERDTQSRTAARLQAELDSTRSRYVTIRVVSYEVIAD